MRVWSTPTTCFNPFHILSTWKHNRTGGGVDDVVDVSIPPTSYRRGSSARRMAVSPPWNRFNPSHVLSTWKPPWSWFANHHRRTRFNPSHVLSTWKQALLALSVQEGAMVSIPPTSYRRGSALLALLEQHGGWRFNPSHVLSTWEQASAPSV